MMDAVDIVVLFNLRSQDYCIISCTTATATGAAVGSKCNKLSASTANKNYTASTQLIELGEI